MKSLKEVPVINKIYHELLLALDVKEKVRLAESPNKGKELAEFVLHLAKQSPNVREFERLLVENQAEFSIELINSIYATVTRMLPEYFKAPS